MKTVRKVIAGIACGCIGLGLIFCILSALSYRDGFYANEDNTFSFQDEVTGVERIDIDAKFGEVEIKSGDRFSVEGNHLMEDGLESYVENGTWHVKEKSDSEASLNLWGWDVPIFMLWFNHDSKDYSPRVVVTIPEGFTAEQLKISLGAGEINADELSTGEASFEVGAGSMEIRHLNVAGQITAEVGAGELTIRDLDTKDASFDCGVGTIYINGKIANDMEADCGIGEISMNLNGNESNYNYKLDCGLGEIQLNDSVYSFSRTEKIQHENAIGTFELDCGIGTITVKMYE